MSGFSVGSIWRKWDLHVHSPASCLNNQFTGSSEDEKWNNYIEKLKELNDIAVLGITDYYSIEGFEKVLSYKDELPHLELILPNIEMRLEIPTQYQIPINIHVIFNPEILSQVKDRVLPSLEFKFQSQGFRCTKSDIIRLGKAFKDDPKLDNSPAFKEGANQFKVNLKNLRDILEGDELLRKNVIVAVSNKSQDGASGLQESNLTAFREEIYRFIDCIFSGNPKDRLYFLGMGTDNLDELTRKYGGRKPCIHGSDAHSLDKIGKPDLNRYTWIKSNPTFQGLKQILFEPEERVFIGEKPKKLKIIESNKTKYIDSIKIEKKPDSQLEDEWFESIKLPINPDLVAIIGNKGSGKSALTDVIGLLCKSKNIEYFSFLHRSKFRAQNSRLAKHFKSSLKWLSGLEVECDLSEDPDMSEDEKVKYIPQKYFETVCNLIETKKIGNEFDKEMKKVIFSHIKEEEKIKKETLDDLIEYKTAQIDQEIDLIVSELKGLNIKIISLEEKNHDEYLKSLESRLATKKDELKSHEENRPEEIADPTQDLELNTLNRRRNNKITSAAKRLSEITSEISYFSELKLKLNEKKGIAESLIEKLNNIDKYLKNEVVDFSLDCEALGINLDTIFKYQINKKTIAKSKEQLEEELTKFDRAEELLIEEQKVYNKKIIHLKDQLDEPSRKYQTYKQSLIEWEKVKSDLIGNETQQDSIKFLEKEIRYIRNDLKPDIECTRKERIEKSGDIYECLLKKVNIYENLYQPVKDFIDSFEHGSKQFSFSAKIKEYRINEFFFDYINKSVKGTFCGEGEKIFAHLLNKIDFSSKEQTLTFLTEVISCLENDQREIAKDEKRNIVDQIKPSKKDELLVFYQELFSLKHLQPHYSLCLDNKDISQLSPGEKGTVLLIFYLLIDKEDIPLIIDQPEENLDNESVYEMLVPAIRKAKMRRQIIIVTHNPNLAVVCNAEQIIKANIDKTDKNKVTYFAGSIEDFDINQNVINILEGTWPAFTNRSNKYLPARYGTAQFDQDTWS